MFSKIRRISRIASKLEDIAKSQSNNNTARFISTEEIIQRENKYSAHNYHPLPVALFKGEGDFIYSYWIYVFGKSELQKVNNTIDKQIMLIQNSNRVSWEIGNIHGDVKFSGFCASTSWWICKTSKIYASNLWFENQ